MTRTRPGATSTVTCAGRPQFSGSFGHRALSRAHGNDQRSLASSEEYGTVSLSGKSGPGRRLSSRMVTVMSSEPESPRSPTPSGPPVPPRSRNCLVRPSSSTHRRSRPPPARSAPSAARTASRPWRPRPQFSPCGQGPAHPAAETRCPPPAPPRVRATASAGGTEQRGRDGDADGSVTTYGAVCGRPRPSPWNVTPRLLHQPYGRTRST